MKITRLSLKTCLLEKITVSTKAPLESSLSLNTTYLVCLWLALSELFFCVNNVRAWPFAGFISHTGLLTVLCFLLYFFSAQNNEQDKGYDR